MHNLKKKKKTQQSYGPLSQQWFFLLDLEGKSEDPYTQFQHLHLFFLIQTDQLT